MVLTSFFFQWGNSGYPLSGTSYDYSAPVQENRLIAAKHSETKLFGLFWRIARDFTKVDRIGNSTDYTTNEDVTATELRNPDTGGAFYVTRHDYSPSTEVSNFRVHVQTSVVNLTIPQKHHITLNGVESKVVVTDFPIGSSGKKFVYSTAEVLTVADFDNRQVVVLWAPHGETGEVVLAGSKHWKIVSGPSSAVETFHDESKNSVVSFTVQSEPLVLDSDNGVQLVVVDRETAYGFWAPNVDPDPLAWENSTGRTAICRAFFCILLTLYSPCPRPISRPKRQYRRRYDKHPRRLERKHDGRSLGRQPSL